VHRELLEVLMDLRRELARRREHSARVVPARLADEAVQDRQHERRGLAAPRGRRTRGRPSLHRGRDRLLLDRGRSKEAELADALEQIGVELEAGEGPVAFLSRHEGPPE
jgi:hypothetical protein